nr:electron transfer flavoprotein subunit beta/FixA family protein [Desulfobacterales bacterium]
MKRLIVCIKQVPDTSDVRIDPETNTLVREGVESILNPLDPFAIEEAVRVKERMGGVVTAITMGPPQAKKVLQHAIALGADEGYLICGPEFAGADTLATSYTLAQAIRRLGNAVLIFCGKQAIDGDTAQVGPGIAAHLDLPQLIYVRKIRKINKRYIVVESMTDTGYEIIRSTLPAVLTVVKEINEPRLPSLKSAMKGRRYEPNVLGGEEIKADFNRLGLKGSPTRVVRIFVPEQARKTKILTGNPEEIAVNLFSSLQKEGVLRCQ